MYIRDIALHSELAAASAEAKCYLRESISCDGQGVTGELFCTSVQGQVFKFSFFSFLFFYVLGICYIASVGQNIISQHIYIYIFDFLQILLKR